MDEAGGIFEEMNSEDCEEVELSATEEEFDSVEDFKESPVSAEIDGVLNEVEDEGLLDSDTDSYDAQHLESDQGSAGIKVLYVNKSTVQSDPQSVSDNQIVILDSSQFEILVNELQQVSKEKSEVQTVSMNDYSGQIHRIEDSVNAVLICMLVLAGMCFGFFVKESLFRGN